MTECEEIAESLPMGMTNQTISMDEARRIILQLNPEWNNGGESHTVIDNTAEAYMHRHNAEVREDKPAKLRVAQSLDDSWVVRVSGFGTIKRGFATKEEAQRYLKEELGGDDET